MLLLSENYTFVDQKRHFSSAFRRLSDANNFQIIDSQQFMNLARIAYLGARSKLMDFLKI